MGSSHYGPNPPAQLRLFDQDVTELRVKVLSATKIATHLRPDLDALLSIWICERVRKEAGIEAAEILFVPAGTAWIEEDILAVDMGAGHGLKRMGAGWSIKNAWGGGSASMALARMLPQEEQEILWAVVKAVSDNDLLGFNVHTTALKESGLWENVQLRNQILTTNIWNFLTCVGEVSGDWELLTIFNRFFDGLIASGKKRKRGAQAVTDALWKFNRRLCITPMDAPPSTSKQAFSRGAVVVLYSAKLGGDRWALGLTRRPDVHSLNLKAIFFEVIEREFPGVFTHPEGFMIGWSAKSPLICSEREFKTIRERFIQITSMVLEAHLT